MKKQQKMFVPMSLRATLYMNTKVVIRRLPTDPIGGRELIGLKAVYAW